MMPITPPICIGERWALDFFPTIGAAKRFVEPWFADEDYVAFDYLGTALKLRAHPRPRKLLRLSSGGEELEIRAAGPPDPEAAAALLRQYLQEAGAMELAESAETFTAL